MAQQTAVLSKQKGRDGGCIQQQFIMGDGAMVFVTSAISAQQFRRTFDNGCWPKRRLGGRRARAGIWGNRSAVILTNQAMVPDGLKAWPARIFWRVASVGDE